jgi:uncharacterized membrane protein
MIVAQDAGGIAGKLADWADPWSKLFSHSKAVSAGVLFLHLVPLVVAAGAAFAADRATLRAARGAVSDRTRQLQELAAIHRIVLGGLALSFISGVLLFLADVETFLGSIFLWVKLSLVFLLVINGLVMTRTERALARSGEDAVLWRRLRTLAYLSAILWLATTLAGVVLKEYA